MVKRQQGLFRIRTAVVAFILFIGMYLLINGSPFGVARLTEITGGQSILDLEMMKGYSVDRAYEILERLGEEGRAFHMRSIAPLDFPFPLTYGLFYFVTLTLIAQSLWQSMKRPWLVGVAGLLATFFDWLENIMVLQLLHRYPERLAGIATAASLFTQLKSVFVTGSMLLIIVGLLAVIIRKIFKAPAKA